MAKVFHVMNEWNATEWTTIRLKCLQCGIPLIVFSPLLESDIGRWNGRELDDSEETAWNPTTVYRMSWNTCSDLHLIGNTSQCGATQYSSFTECNPTLSEWYSSKELWWRENGWDWRQAVLYPSNDSLLPLSLTGDNFISNWMEYTVSKRPQRPHYFPCQHIHPNHPVFAFWLDIDGYYVSLHYCFNDEEIHPYSVHALLRYSLHVSCDD